MLKFLMFTLLNEQILKMTEKMGEKFVNGEYKSSKNTRSLKLFVRTKSAALFDFVNLRVFIIKSLNENIQGNTG